MLIMHNMVQNNNYHETERGKSMEERIYKTMAGSGALSIVVGVISIVVGLAGGILLIVSGSKLVSAKSKVLF